jgi:glycerol-1-phosphate dehydrogenase [NAD(P)+]
MADRVGHGSKLGTTCVKRNATISLGLSNLKRIDQALKENDPLNQFADLAMGEVVVAENVVSMLDDVVARYLAKSGRKTDGAKVCVVVDPVKILRAGADLKAQVAGELRRRHVVSMVVLDDGEAVLHADERILDEAARATAGADCIVSVGGGTISDIAKVAAQRSEVPVHIIIQTAASVDGYTDNFSIILQNGVKKTVLSRWPEAVLADVRTIAEAPRFLTAAGMGEMMSMFCAPGDWYIAAQLGVDKTFTPVLLELLALCGDGIEDWSKGLAAGNVGDAERLAAALDMRGIVTGVGGTTATLSGMEHLFSHMLDMVAGEQHTKMGLHGAQVGVGAILRAAAWEVFCERMAETPADPGAMQANIAAHLSTVKAAFHDLDPSGKIGEECAGRFRTKLAALTKSWPQVEAFFSSWAAHRAAHDELVFGSEKIAGYLARANAPMRFDELDPPLTEDLTRWVIANCQFMRERLTVADLLYLAGWLDDEGVGRIIARADAAIAAAKGS